MTVPRPRPSSGWPASRWWISAFPGLAILMVAVACNFVGDAIDPRLREG
jgi:ABC-type dipeptide/oligopeptide/nickel transport system permease subunit